MTTVNGISGKWILQGIVLGILGVSMIAPAGAHEAHKKKVETAPAIVEEAAPLEKADESLSDSEVSVAPAPKMVETGDGAEAEEATIHEHSGVARVVLKIGKLHPLVVHFPIALLVTALFAEIIHLRKPGGSHVAPFMVYFATAFALLAVGLGLAFEELGVYEGAAHELIERHEFAGLTTLAFALCASFFRVWRNGRHRVLYLAALVLAVIAVNAAGFLGGALIYGVDHFFFWR